MYNVWLGVSKQIFATNFRVNADKSKTFHEIAVSCNNPYRFIIATQYNILVDKL